MASLVRKNIFSFLLLLLCNHQFIYAQELNIDELSIVKTWLDDNGEEVLYIHVEGACNNYDSKNEFSKFGQSSSIHIKLKNRKGEKVFNYENPTYNSTLMLYSDAIWLKEYDWLQAVFIPIFYCSAQHGAVMPLSYIIIYNNNIEIVHLRFQCKPGVLGQCTPAFNKTLVAGELRDFPREIQNDFLNYINEKYTSREDLYPNHMTFKQKKYKDYNLGSVSFVEEGSYPQTLLNKVLLYIENNNCKLAQIYLKEFKYLYVNESDLVNISGFRTALSNKKINYSTDSEINFITAQQYIEKGDFQSAYQLVQQMIIKVNNKNSDCN